MECPYTCWTANCKVGCKHDESFVYAVPDSAPSTVTLANKPCPYTCGHRECNQFYSELGLPKHELRSERRYYPFNAPRSIQARHESLFLHRAPDAKHRHAEQKIRRAASVFADAMLGAIYDPLLNGSSEIPHDDDLLATALDLIEESVQKAVASMVLEATKAVIEKRVIESLRP